MRNRGQRLARVFFLAGAVGACSRASAPPPPSDSAQPIASGVLAEPSAAVPPSRNTAPPTSTPLFAGPAPTTRGSAASSECSKLEPADARARATCEAKEEFRSFVSTRQACATAAECSVLTGSCPFGCFVPVTKAAVEDIRAKLGSLGDRLEQAGHRCVYRCLSPPNAACVEGRCSTAAP